MITREELKAHCERTIEQCEFWARGDNKKLDNSKLYQEHKLILELLEQEPCEDCVSREAVLEIAKSSKSNWIDNSVLFKRVNELPSVTPQPKVAHWIHFASSDDCSGCGWSTGKYISPSDYCPKCGARMIEPVESEEQT